MSVQLLDKTRKINKVLHNSNPSKVLFSDIAKVMSEILDSNVLIISKKGKLLGTYHNKDTQDIYEFQNLKVGEYIDSDLNERFLSILSTKENVNLATLGFDYEISSVFQAIVTPVNIASERLATVFMYKNQGDYEINDIVLSEYGTTVVGLEMLRSVHEETAEEERKNSIVKSAINTLSLSEKEAVKYVLDDLNGVEGTLVASKIADRVGITRSVIVNALRKLESAGVVETRSSGVKGTYIKVINDLIFKYFD